jgi:hypothetical protein
MNYIGIASGLIGGILLGIFCFSQIQLIRSFGKRLVDKLGDGGFLTEDRSVLIKRYRNTEILCFSIMGVVALLLAALFAKEIFFAYLAGVFTSLFSVRVQVGFTGTNLREFLVINRQYLDLSNVGEDDDPIIVALKVELDEMIKVES